MQSPYPTWPRRCSRGRRQRRDREACLVDSTSRYGPSTSGSAAGVFAVKSNRARVGRVDGYRPISRPYPRRATSVISIVTMSESGERSDISRPRRRSSERIHRERTHHIHQSKASHRPIRTDPVSRSESRVYTESANMNANVETSFPTDETELFRGSTLPRRQNAVYNDNE